MSKHSREHVDKLEYLLREISAIIKRRGREILSDYPLTPPQFNALLALRHMGNPTMSQLCDHLALASSTVTDLVDRMERSELVERIRDSEDRRVIRLRVTPRGQEVFEAVISHRRLYLAGVLENLNEQTVGGLIDHLTVLHGLMHDEQNSRPRPRHCEADSQK